jgi:Tfp pilus assembly protein PilZ
MKREVKDKRRERRISALLPVELGNREGFAVDVSSSGMFLEADSSYALGSEVSLAMNLDTPWGRVMFECHGKVVRLEPRDGTVGVAVQFTESATAHVVQATTAKRAGKKAVT